MNSNKLEYSQATKNQLSRYQTAPSVFQQQNMAALQFQQENPVAQSTMQRMHDRFFLSRICVCLVLALLSGCEQRRYQPSTYRPSSNTLPQPAQSLERPVAPAQGTLVLRNNTLPLRGTLPNRGSLPMRAGSTLPGWSSLPVRERAFHPDRIWDTGPKEDMPRRTPVTPIWSTGRPAATLPVRGTMPIRSDVQTLPRRINQRLVPTTLPLRPDRGMVPDHLLPRSPLRQPRGDSTIPERFRRTIIPRGTLPQRRPLR